MAPPEVPLLPDVLAPPIPPEPLVAAPLLPPDDEADVVDAAPAVPLDGAAPSITDPMAVSAIVPVSTGWLEPL
ncbi:hypothetical protein [Acidiphilium sp.]|uniref:hypothetical protein n=1 Tax=Acidiphilium sp. TaxID=527 RepID=UPI003D072016